MTSFCSFLFACCGTYSLRLLSHSLLKLTASNTKGGSFFTAPASSQNGVHLSSNPSRIVLRGLSNPSRMRAKPKTYLSTNVLTANLEVIVERKKRRIPLLHILHKYVQLQQLIRIVDSTILAHFLSSCQYKQP